MMCRNCPELIEQGPLPGDRAVTGWFHTGSGSELCGSVQDEADHRVAEPSFQFEVNTDHGATFTPWTNGWAIGFKVTADAKPDRYIVFNPSGASDGGLDTTDVFVYLVDPAIYIDVDGGVPGADENTLGGMLDTPECYINIWNEP